jgi:hypothetical protein
MDVKKYIESGILELYVLGEASAEEVQELFSLCDQYPEIITELNYLENTMEQLAKNMEVNPPVRVYNEVERRLEDMGQIDSDEPDEQDLPRHNYIEVQAVDNHMRIHRLWRWVFLAVFILSKIFLAFAVYFYIEYRTAQSELRHLKTENSSPHR